MGVIAFEVLSKIHECHHNMDLLQKRECYAEAWRTRKKAWGPPSLNTGSRRHSDKHSTPRVTVPLCHRVQDSPSAPSPFCAFALISHLLSRAVANKKLTNLVAPTGDSSTDIVRGSRFSFFCRDGGHPSCRTPRDSSQILLYVNSTVIPAIMAFAHRSSAWCARPVRPVVVLHRTGSLCARSRPFPFATLW